MTTAAARTDAIGNSVSGMDSGVGSTSKTDHFKIEGHCGGSSMFLDIDAYKEVRACVMGDLLNHGKNWVQLIAAYMFENGMSLRTDVCIYALTDKKNKSGEIRTKQERFIVISGRVYAKHISEKHQKECEL
jgi:hypothetical protein